MNLFKKFILNKVCKLKEDELVLDQNAKTLIALVNKLSNSVTKASWMQVDVIVLYDKYSLYFRNHQLRRCAVYNQLGWWKWLFKHDVELPDFSVLHWVFHVPVIITRNINIERKDKAMAVIFGTNIMPKIHTKSEPKDGKMGSMGITVNAKPFDDIFVCADENDSTESIQEYVTNKFYEICKREETSNPLP